MNELSPVSLLKNGASPEVNPVRTSENWSAFHAQIAAETLHWFVPDAGAWGSQSADGDWTGWRADTGEPVSLHLGAAFQSWTNAFDASDPPFWRW